MGRERYLQYGKLAANRLRAKLPGADLEQLRDRLVEQLGLMQGLPQKIGQILSFREFELEAKSWTRLSESNSQTLALSEIQEILEAALSPASYKRIQHISEQGHGASLGQVHRARLDDGRTIALKLRYPGIEQRIEQDLRALGWLSEPVGSLRRYDLSAYRELIATMLKEELDYEHEAKQLRYFSQRACEIPSLQVPEPVEGFCTPNVLGMRWLEGESYPALASWSQEHRQQAGDCLLQCFLACNFRWGRIHADPHPGNLRFAICDGQVRVGLLDFGCVRPVSKSFQSGLAMLARMDANFDARTCFEALGFDAALLRPLEGRLQAIAKILAEPFHAGSNWRPSQWQLADRLKQDLGNEHMQFRMAGEPGLIYWIRAFHGLMRYLGWLEWRGSFAELAADYLQTVNPQPREKQAASSPTSQNGKVLCLRVLEGQVQKAKLTFPVRAVDKLADLLPEDLQPRLKARNIDPGEIARELARKDYPEGPVFTLEEPEKTVNIWIEAE